MQCPKCTFEQPDANTECSNCSIIFEKYEATQAKLATIKPKSVSYQKVVLEYAKDILLYVQPEVNPIFFGGRIIVFGAIVIWGALFMFHSVESNYVGMSFLHNVNLPFHEAGHIFFGLFGRFIGTLGGTLGQLLMPFICLVVIVIKTRDNFGGSVCLWWLGESFMDIAPYINDARALKLMLLGGVTGRETVDYHDWEYILRHLGWRHLDHALAAMSHYFGIFLMLCAFLWGGYILFKQSKHLTKY